MIFFKKTASSKDIVGIYFGLYFQNKNVFPGIPNQRRLLRKSPSDRIGSNFTPTAKHLTVAGLRELRRQAAIQRREYLAGIPREISPAKKPRKREVDKELDYPRARLE